ncbi:MAG: GTPase ObgE [Candidatus Harrisonbacteria bacterium]|nr:GTPase ObgE [Candidatus Harrisonbacteria bacterium]
MIDEVTIKVRAGNGGNGKVAFAKGPSETGVMGGDGGKGGDVYLEGVSDLDKLRSFRFQKEFAAQDGAPGGLHKLTGKDGADLILQVPVGTLAKREEDEEVFEVLEVGQRILIAKGGRGGRGNWHFRSATNRSPKLAERGRTGKSFTLKIELRLIADIGLIGLPSAGKSSLLNALTSASAKVGAYHFTTLEPNLGVLYLAGSKPLILADIPGLISGAAEGRGLGIKFLRHIQRTRYLMHCVSAESEDVEEDYDVIRQELGRYSQELTEKPECILLTKIDLFEEAQWCSKFEKLEKNNDCILAVSIHEKERLEKLTQLIGEKLGKDATMEKD